MPSTTTGFPGGAAARTLRGPAARLHLRGVARHVLRLWWAGWQAHVSALPPGDCRK